MGGLNWNPSAMARPSSTASFALIMYGESSWVMVVSVGSFVCSIVFLSFCFGNSRLNCRVSIYEMAMRLEQALILSFAFEKSVLAR
mgnify:CR=1 FL=1